MATIKPIEGRSVHQIQSGQVIVDLQSVCKELVENSIDAGATSVEIRFKNNGLDAIEVQDNGTGISPDDYETIALKHYTSKLSSYDDLSSLQTFGFRGEALSSLCALSNFHIITARPADGSKGTKLEFEQSGKLKATSIVAAKQGTTVSVEKLFYNLPVRRKELEKNIKREYNKVLQLLNAYACISVGVKFTVSNLMPKGKKTLAFSTNSNATTRDNISNVYGAKTITALIPLDLEFEMDASNRPGATQNARNWSTQDDPGSCTVKLVGHISRPVVGEGRQTPDRQMFFVNSRPCNLPQVAKAMNEVYKSYNVTQSPFIFADIQLDTNAYDVNVSPDKRTIMLHDQTALLERLKDALLTLFEGHDQTVPQASLTVKNTPGAAFKAPTLVPRESTEPLVTNDSSDGEIPPPVRHIPKRKATPPPMRNKSGITPLPGFVKASHIQEFAGRDAEDRGGALRAVRRRRSSSSESDKTNQERVLHPAIRPHAAAFELTGDDSITSSRPRSHSPLFEPDDGIAPEPKNFAPQSRVVQDFNARMASQQNQPGRNCPPLDADGESEEPISSVKQTPQRTSSQSTIQNAFDRMRPLRMPVQQATITIGDSTTITTIGSTNESRSAKRARIHTPKFSLSGKPLEQTPKQSLFAKSLHGYAAPGTQAESSEEDDGEANMPALLARSPSPHKRLPAKDFEEPRTDDFAVSSNITVPSGRRADVEPLDTDSVPDLEPHVEAPIEESDEEYVDEAEKKLREEAMVAKLVAEAEEAAARPTEANMRRASKLFKVSQNKHKTLNLERIVETDVDAIERHMTHLQTLIDASTKELEEVALPTTTLLNQQDPEERLSLTVTKPDFHSMRIIGQFNLGFIIAVRPPTCTSPSSDVFIIDQHASDEKYNFERLSATTTLVSQRLVHPHPLELTAVEQELILANTHALTANGFGVEISTSEDDNGKSHATLTSLPMSKEVTFTPLDLSELLALILDNPPSLSPDAFATTTSSRHIPRPSKVRKLLASRACRSSVMIGKTLTVPRMREIVRHMGDMDKPWSCPHGRPTMRHLFGLERWEGWKEGDSVVDVDAESGVEKVSWGEYLARKR
ncbi:ATP-binding mismatch repair protein [Pleosporales sp. CAS-2024a]